MMTEKNNRMADALMDAMNHIDDDLILSAERARSGAGKRRAGRGVTAFRYAVYALAALVVFGIGISRLKKDASPSQEAALAPQGEGIEVAYVNVEELLAAREETTGDIVTDLDDSVITDFKADGGNKEGLFMTLPYDGSKVQVVRLNTGEETAIYARVAVTQEGQERLSSCKGEPLADEEGWFYLAGHEDKAYLIYEDADGTCGLWEKR